MGVPGLFSFFRRRYPQICNPAEKRKDSSQPQVDNLYIDMNHIIHSCTHAHVAKDRPDISQAEMFAGMAAYLQQLLDLLEPRRVVLIAIDGVAPRAKMNQQRTRRFLSAYVSGITDNIEREVRREMTSEAGGLLHVPDVKRFDSNIITPGTDFMLQLADWLHQWASSKVKSDPRFKHTTFVISDASEPGEGEHKIMKFVRHLKTKPDCDPNTTHVVYGQDADLLLLALLCHEPHFTVMRENMDTQGGPASSAVKEALQEELDHQRPLSAVEQVLKQQQQQQQQQHPPGFPSLPAAVSASPAAVAAASHSHLHMPTFEKVDIGVLRECIQWEFSDLVGPPGPPGTYGSDDDSDTEPDGAADTDYEGSPQQAAGAASTSSSALRQHHSWDGVPGAGGRGCSDKNDDDDDVDDLLRLAISDPLQVTSSTAAAGALVSALQSGNGNLEDSTAAAATAKAVPHIAARPRNRGKSGLRFESVLDDLVVLSFLAGNDFLPNVPSIDIYDKPCGLDLLFAAYKALLPQMGGHLSGGGSINRSRLMQLLVFLARDEEAAYKRRADYRHRRAQQQRDEQAAATADFHSLFDGGLSMGELPPGLDIEKLDKLLMGLGPELADALGLSAAMAANRAAGVDLLSMTGGQLCEELQNRVAARVKEKLMGGDPWAQDPVGMDLPGYRERYYEMRFPELYQSLEGDVDKVAARVSWEYLQGMDWVLRYYTCGPAALDWRQQQLAGNSCGSSGGSTQEAAAAAGVSGASWTWCYSYHYAPLMQDLAKAKLWQKAGSSAKASVSVGPVSISRALNNPVSCSLDDWAPTGGPIRPLLQLMCVLPAKSVLAALPASLAHLIVLAEAMEEEEEQQASRQHQHHHQQLQQHQHQRGHLSKAARKAARKARRSAVAAKVDGLKGLEVLTALGDEDDVDEDGAEDEEDGALLGYRDEHEEGVDDELTGEGNGQVGGFLHHVIGDDPESSMMRLAQELCATFPNNVEQLVDLTGKRWLHTGVVRLPQAQPQHMAAVLQAVLSLQQQQQPWQQLPWQQQQQQQALLGLTQAEISRNAFRPSVAVATADAAAAAGAAVGVAALPPNSAATNGGSSSSSTSPGSVWCLLTRTITSNSNSSSSSATSAYTRAGSAVAAAAAVQPSVAAAAPPLGALGLLLSQRRALHTLPTNTLQHLPQSQEVQVFTGQLDVAGLPVPEHSCCLLPGAEPSPLTVTSAVWRRTKAGFASAVNYAEKVLAIRSSAPDNGNSNGGRNGSNRGRGRGFGAVDASRGSRGRGRQASDRSSGYNQHQPQQQSWQISYTPTQPPQQFEQYERYGPPAVDPSMAAYYYTADDDYDGYEGGGYNGGYDSGGAYRGKGRKMGLGNRGRTYRSHR